MIKKNQKTIILVLAILGTAVLSYFIETLLVLPYFFTMNSNNDKVQTEKNKVEQINISITNLKGQKKEEVGSLKKFLGILLPEELDSLHFASLNEVVAASSGVIVSGIQISKGLTGTAAPATGVGQTSQVSANSVNVTYTSSFESLLSLIRNWVLADRLVGPTTAIISSQNSSALQYTISYELPLSAKQIPATVSENISLGQKEIEELEKIRSKITFTATPSAKPLGKEDPFH